MENLSKSLFLYYKANEDGGAQLPQQQQKNKKRRREEGTEEVEEKSGVEKNDEMLRERIQLLIADVEL
jgi:hypothetical protein